VARKAIQAEFSRVQQDRAVERVHRAAIVLESEDVVDAAIDAALEEAQAQHQQARHQQEQRQPPQPRRHQTGAAKDGAHGEGSHGLFSLPLKGGGNAKFGAPLKRGVTAPK
jgi:hypothetical protein